MTDIGPARIRPGDLDGDRILVLIRKAEAGTPLTRQERDALIINLDELREGEEWRKMREILDILISDKRN